MDQPLVKPQNNGSIGLGGDGLSISFSKGDKFCDFAYLYIKLGLLES